MAKWLRLLVFRVLKEIGLQRLSLKFKSKGLERLTFCNKFRVIEV